MCTLKGEESDRSRRQGVWLMSPVLKYLANHRTADRREMCTNLEGTCECCVNRVSFQAQVCNSRDQSTWLGLSRRPRRFPVRSVPANRRQARDV
jgi:hypothetical protein